MRTKEKELKDFGLKLVKRDAPPPKQKEVTEDLFGIQGELDFSLMMGEPMYHPRTVSYTVKTYEHDPEWFRLLKTRLEKWILDGREAPIYDDYDPGLYFKGKGTSVDLNVDDASGEASYTLNFKCYPFRISELKEGHDNWDDFNFYLDYSQDVEFDIEGEKEITLMNNGSHSVAPKIITDSNFILTKGNQVYEVTPGTNQNIDFRLMIGDNAISITGTGHIEFEFYKELI
ncbi:MAG: hypothetical protein L0J63_01220 [Tetragenococcus koreensis]|nr:hypothetical protein [Tetragenococcus koreensis]